MDTDNLTEMAYQSIILADDATDVLKCELGVLCGRFKSEDEYLKRVLEYLAKLAEEPEDYLDAWENMSGQARKVAKFALHPERAAFRIAIAAVAGLICIIHPLKFLEAQR